MIVNTKSTVDFISIPKSHLYSISYVIFCQLIDLQMSIRGTPAFFDNKNAPEFFECINDNIDIFIIILYNSVTGKTV